MVEQPSAREAAFDAHAKIKVPPKRRVGNELSDLRRRARTAGALSRAAIPLQVRASVELYKALVELAEEYHQPVATIARQCLEDGVRKYRDFSDPALNPFGKVALARSHPQVLSPSKSLAARFAPQRQGPSPEPEDEDVEIADLERYTEKLATLPPGLVLPSTPPIGETHRTKTEPEEPLVEPV